MSATDIVGYTYKCENYMPAQLIEVLIAEGRAAPAARGMRAEDVLDQIVAAEALDLDRMDEHSFDSGDFPKVIFESQITEEDDDWWRP
jgi:hypothetical protein